MTLLDIDAGIRLIRAGVVLARHGALDPVATSPDVPASLRVMASIFIRATAFRKPRAGERPLGLAMALHALGPSYIKLGQFAATRPDIVGAEVRQELRVLQDALPPFPTAEARAEIARALSGSVEDHFHDFQEPVAAASIAQVHFATTPEGQEVAVKVLRPGIEAAFQQDLRTFYFAARLAELVSAEARRLRPVAIVDTLAEWVQLEMDLRMEAAAASEFAETTADDPRFIVPEVDWARSARRVLTVERVHGIAFSDHDAMLASGQDMAEVGAHLIRAFLSHATVDGFFHGDLHEGNLFLGEGGTIAAVDFGIMGRLGPKEQRFLAEVLFGFLERDYERVAELHFEAGYVPRTQDSAAFAQALRAIGEPIFGRTADDVSMGRVLAQLFDVTEQFGMRTQTELLLLQKTMVTVEGVARSLDPNFDMWEAARPVIETWMWENVGPEARLRELAWRAGNLATALPKLAENVELIARMAEDGPGNTATGGATASTGRGLPPVVWLAAGAGAMALVFALF